MREPDVQGEYPPKEGSAWCDAGIASPGTLLRTQGTWESRLHVQPPPLGPGPSGSHSPLYGTHQQDSIRDTEAPPPVRQIALWGNQRIGSSLKEQSTM